MKIFIRICLIAYLLVSATACGSQSESSPVTAAENYITALAAKDKAQVVSLSCKEWEEAANLEVDALLSVEADVSNLSCSLQNEIDGEAEVICSGSLDLTYNDEIRAIDLSRRIYTLRFEDKIWRVCSYE